MKLWKTLFKHLLDIDCNFNDWANERALEQAKQGDYGMSANDVLESSDDKYYMDELIAYAQEELND